MRWWNISPDPNFVLYLTADARLGPVSYTNDQIWELNFGEGEPPAIALRTTYGLRARAQRMFPRFGEGDRLLSDPAQFARAPLLRSFHPSFVRLEMAPFPDIDVAAEFWVPQSQAIAGRVQFTNQSDRLRQVRFEWVASLTPTNGQRMAAEQIQASNVLCGQTGDLFPVVFMTGGAQHGKGPYNSLVLDLEMEPGAIHSLTWCHAALDSHQASFEMARGISALPWDAYIARLDLLDASSLEIYTGNPDWDLAFALSQTLAHSFFTGPTDHLPRRSFVHTRQPDQGYSPRGDGGEYSPLWSGQSPLEALYLTGMLLPGSTELAADILLNFLSVQSPDGAIDWKPGLAGQRSRLMATPLLAHLAWQIFEVTQDRAFLEKVFTPLLSFVRAWFTPEHDRDQDDIPEWDHPVQTGLEEHPFFSQWQPEAASVDIRTAESPALGAMLYSECLALIEMARLLRQDSVLTELQALIIGLHIQVEACWDEAASCYRYRDRDSHTSPAGGVLGILRGPGTLHLSRHFDQQARLMVRIQTHGETRPRPRIFIHGESTSGQHRVERIEADQVRWALDQGLITGERSYTAIERVELQGLLPQDEVTISVADYDCQDLTLLLPLWGGIPAPKRVVDLVEKTITNPGKYWLEYGLPVCPLTVQAGEASDGDVEESEPSLPEEVCQAVNLPINSLIGEGLAHYGYREAAAMLVERLMAGIVAGVKHNGVLRRSFNAVTGQTLGETNALAGLAPLSLFLKALGVRILSPSRLHLVGYNPFQWPVTVKYRGLTVLRQKDKTVVIFPGGQTVEVTDPAPQIVALE